MFIRDAIQRSHNINGHVNWGAGSTDYCSHVAGAWTERKKMFHGGTFLKLADDDV